MIGKNVSPMEFQARRKGTDEWIYLSDPIEDFYEYVMPYELIK